MHPKWVTAVAVGLFGVLVLLPSAYMLGAAFISEQGISLSAFEALTLDDRQISLIYNSLILALGSATASVVLGVPLAFLAARTDVAGGRLLRYASLLPLLIPPHIHAIAWRGVLPLSGPFGTLWVLTLAYYPFVTLLTLSGLARVERRMEEAAMLSRSELAVVRHITLPLVSPHILAGATLVFVFAVADYGVPAVWQVNTYPVEIFASFSAFYDDRAAAALAFPLILLTICILLLQKLHMGRRSYVSMSAGSVRPALIGLGRWKAPASAASWLFITVAVAVPVGALIMESGSPQTYLKAFETAAEPIAMSLALAAAGATLTVLVSLPLAYVIERSARKTGQLLDILSVVPFAVPATVVGIGLINIWNWPALEALYGSFVMLPIAFVARSSPFVVRVLTASVKQVGASLEEAAVLSRNTWLSRARHIVIPLVWPGLAIGWMISFVLGLGELGATLLIVPPGWETLSLRIYSLMHYGANDLVAALSVILVVLSSAAILLLLAVINLGKASAIKASLSGTNVPPH